MKIKCYLCGKTKVAFTLIELLIVVAIIAILAAIAVPNFLEAQVRAKVSRLKADIRTAATAVESYVVDANIYPPPDAVPVGTDFVLAGQSFFPITEDPPENYLSHRLTTPIAYITSLPLDIFPNAADGPKAGFPDPHTPHYVNDQFNSKWTAAPWAGDRSFEFFSARSYAALLLFRDVAETEYNYAVQWHIHSHGPDLDHDDFLGDAGIPTEYDPTNGTVSDGDIFYFGPGRGFTR
jgi:prepilin-type N-terminal cleavage/methylation domain-containing protein